jgi:hypothetical protein
MFLVYSDLMGATMNRNYIGDMRQRLGLEPDDTSRDCHIEGMTPMERLRLLCGWNLGDPDWAQSVIAWVTYAGFTVKS